MLQRETKMKKALILITCVWILLISASTLIAKDKYNITVLPFTLNSADNIDYVKQGIWDMLITRTAVPNKIDVTSKSVVQDELKKANLKDISLADVYKIGSSLKADYVVWGSITKIGNSISIDGKLIDIISSKSDIGIFAQTQSLDDVIPKINDFSQRIVQHVTGAKQPVLAQSALPAAAAAPAASAASPSRESQIIAGMRTGKKGTLTSVINAELINSPDPFNRRGFWMSQKFPTEFKGMDIGDVNGDGLNEVVLIDKNTILICQKMEKDLRVLQRINGKNYHNYLSVDVADINRNGISEIFITALNDKILETFVLEFKEGKYVEIATKLPFFLRILETPSGVPLLLGQYFGRVDKPFNTPIYEIVWRNGAYVEDQLMKIPLGLSIYGLVIDDFGTGGGEKILALDELDYICIFEKTSQALTSIFTFGFKNKNLVWRSDDVFGGSNNYLENLDDKKRPDENEKSAYVNLRILAHDINKDGKKEIIIAKNLSSSGRVFKNMKLFTASEIYSLEWDGIGMAENWKTKKINGYIADYVLKDVDNDGKPELVLSLVLSVGTSISDKSVIVIYKLETPQ